MTHLFLRNILSAAALLALLFTPTAYAGGGSAELSIMDFWSATPTLFASPTGDAAYAFQLHSDAVCAATNHTALLAPMCLTMIGGLYGTLDDGVSTLDPIHGCYLSGPLPDGTRQCTRMLQSSSSDCGGRVIDSLDEAAAMNDGSPLLPPRAGKYYNTSARALAAYVAESSEVQLRMKRSLRRTIEVAATLETIIASVTRTAGTPSPSLLAAATKEVLQVLDRDYERVVEKYSILLSLATTMLGGANIPTMNYTDFVQKQGVFCPLENTISGLLGEFDPQESSDAVAQRIAYCAAAMIDDPQHYPIPKRGVLCIQALFVAGEMAQDDLPLRWLYEQLVEGTLTRTEPWIASAFRSIHTLIESIPSSKMTIEGSVQNVFGTLCSDEHVNDIFRDGGLWECDCMRRAILRIPDPITGDIPPSIAWCQMNSTMPARAVAGFDGDLGIARDTCAWGWSQWAGDCDRACYVCPAGAVGDGDGHCVCPEAADTHYISLEGGCKEKGKAHAMPMVAFATSTGPAAPVVVLPSNEKPMELFTVRMPPGVAAADPSAYLTVDITCTAGVTVFDVSSAADRSAPCGGAVLFERRVERAGVLGVHQANTTHRALTYATSVTVAVTSGCGFFGDTCSFSASVRSTLRRDSDALDAGALTFLPQLASFTLVPAVVEAWAPCEDLIAAGPVAAVQRVGIGMCVLSDQDALFVDLRAYRVLEGAALDALRVSAGTGSVSGSIPLSEAMSAALSRISVTVQILNASGETLARASWPLLVSGDAGFVRATTGISAQLLRKMRGVEVTLGDGGADGLSGAGLAPVTSAFAYSAPEKPSTTSTTTTTTTTTTSSPAPTSSSGSTATDSSSDRAATASSSSTSDMDPTGSPTSTAAPSEPDDELVRTKASDCMVAAIAILSIVGALIILICGALAFFALRVWKDAKSVDHLPLALQRVLRFGNK